MEMGKMPLEMAVAIDELGYELLRGAGYDTAGCERFENRRKRLKNRMKRDGAVLEFDYSVDKKGEVPALCVRFTLKRKGKEPVKSKILRFVGKTPEDLDEDDENQEGEGEHGEGSQV